MLMMRTSASVSLPTDKNKKQVGLCERECECARGYGGEIYDNCLASLN